MISKKRPLISLFDHLAPASIGFLVFYMVAGALLLDPTNIGWLINAYSSEDPAQHFIGWHTFRSSDWSWPLGVNEGYGAELSSSIIYTDSIALLAIIFKVFDSLLPEVFQYSGWWLATCFMLQAIMGWKLMGLATNNRLAKACAAGILVLMPALSHRMIYHFGLTAHFVILAAIYLSLAINLPTKRAAWFCLIALTALIHPYLLAMVLPIWLADLWAKQRSEAAEKGHLVVLDLFSVAMGILGIWWITGYFVISDSASSTGFGYFRANLATFVDPVTHMSNSWSFLLPNIPGEKDDYEGFAFLGLGVLILVFCATALAVKHCRSAIQSCKKWMPLLIASVGMAVYALSYRIGIGAYTFEVPLTDKLIELGNIFRASGRMIWPLMYMIVIGSLFCLIRFGSKKWVYPLLVGCIAVQVWDMREGIEQTKAQFKVEPVSKMTSGLDYKFWNEAAKRYEIVRGLMPQNQSKYWLEMSKFSIENGLDNDVVYLSRADNEKLKRLSEKAMDVLISGNYDSNSLYVMNEQMAFKVYLSMDSEKDLLLKADKMFVLAPDWKECMICSQAYEEYSPDFSRMKIEPNVRIGMNNPLSAKMLVHGWSDPETWGVWSNGSSATIAIPVPESIADFDRVTLEVSPFVTPDNNHQVATIYQNGMLTAVEKLDSGEPKKVIMPITSRTKEMLTKKPLLKIDIEIPRAQSPFEAGVGNDRRKLGIGLRSLTIQ